MVFAGHAASPAARIRLGGEEVAALSCGTRSTLWIRHYTAQLFVPAGETGAALLDPGEPKLLRLRILNAFLMPGEIPRRWREALRPVLTEKTFARLRGAYQELKSGQQVLIAYRPQQGVSVEIDGRLIARAEGHRAIEALVAAWADGAPVRDKLRETIQRNPC